MWNDIVSRVDVAAHMLPFAALDLLYRYPLVFSMTVLATASLASMLCFEFQKAEKLQARWDEERARKDRPVRLR